MTNDSLCDPRPRTPPSSTSASSATAAGRTPSWATAGAAGTARRRSASTSVASATPGRSLGGKGQAWLAGGGGQELTAPCHPCSLFLLLFPCLIHFLGYFLEGLESPQFEVPKCKCFSCASTPSVMILFGGKVGCWRQTRPPTQHATS